MNRYRASFIGGLKPGRLSITVKASTTSKAAMKALNLAGSEYVMVDIKRAN